MSFIGNIGRTIGAWRGKASAAGRAIVAYNLGQPVWTPRNYASIAQKTYRENAVVFACVRKKAEALASIPLELYKRPRTSGRPVEVGEHDLLRVLANPNPMMAYANLAGAWSSYRDLAGNAYLEAVTRSESDQTVLEIYAHRPDRMTLVPDANGWPARFRYYNGGFERFWDVRPGFDRVRPIWHAKDFDPLNDWYGMGPAEASLNSVDVTNGQKAYAKALLDNAATPSGAFVYDGDKDGGSVLTQDQRDSLRREIEDRISGPKNAGRPLILGGGLKWQPMSSSLKDMEWNDSGAANAREIALSFGVPPLLLGIPGDNTHANYEEANRSFWRDTILPRAREWTGGLTSWLCAPRNEGLFFAYDEDAIPALFEERKALFEMVEKASFLTIDEKREAVGYAPTPGGDIVMIEANKVTLADAAAGIDRGEDGSDGQGAGLPN